MTLTLDIDRPAGGREPIQQHLLLALRATGSPLTPVPAIPVRAVLTWMSENPLVVEVEFLNDDAPPIDWIWGRDLLHAGLSKPAGIPEVGDVQVRPAGIGEVEIELSNETGRALFTAPAGVLAEFLRRTYAAIPAGSEYEPATSATQAVDDLLREWLTR